MATLARHAWRACEVLGLAGAIRQGVLIARAAPNGWRHRATVDGVEASFATTSWPEYRRVTTLHGEARIIERLLEALDGSEVVWDVGANVGVYACFVARALTTGTVIGFEPEPVNEQRLARNLRENAPRRQWETYRVALSDRDGTTELAAAGARAARGVVGAGHHYTADRGRIRVHCGRGDSLVAAGLPAPDVLKVDVQGAEGAVIEGMGDVLDDVDRVYVELHTEKCHRYGTTANSVEELLRGAGFSVTDLGEPDGNRSGVYFAEAVR